MKKMRRKRKINLNFLQSAIIIYCLLGIVLTSKKIFAICDLVILLGLIPQEVEGIVGLWNDRQNMTRYQLAVHWLLTVLFVINVPIVFAVAATIDQNCAPLLYLIYGLNLLVAILNLFFIYKNEHKN